MAKEKKEITLEEAAVDYHKAIEEAQEAQDEITELNASLTEWDNKLKEAKKKAAIACNLMRQHGQNLAK